MHGNVGKPIHCKYVWMYVFAIPAHITCTSPYMCHLHPQVCRPVLWWTSALTQTPLWLCQCVLDTSAGSCRFGSRSSCRLPTGWRGRSVQQPTWPPSLHVKLTMCTISRSTRATQWGATKAVRLIELIRRHRKVRPCLASLSVLWG